MFGYVRPNAKLLRVYEYEIYKSAYCGLCKTLKRHAGILPRLLLNYDFVALVLARMYFTNERAQTELSRCGAHPLKKRNIMKENEALRFSSAVFCAFLYAKAKDNYYDSKGIVRAAYKVFSLYLWRICKKMKKVCDIDTEKLSAVSEKTLELEKRHGTSLDALCAVFGETLSECLSFGLEEKARECAKVVGFQLGRFVYICDAVDDLERDEKSGNFNPLLSEYGNAASARAAVRESRNVYLTGMYESQVKISEMKKENNNSLFEILTNIFCLGAEMTFDKVLKGEKDD